MLMITMYEWFYKRNQTQGSSSKNLPITICNAELSMKLNPSSISGDYYDYSVKVVKTILKTYVKSYQMRLC